MDSTWDGVVDDGYWESCGGGKKRNTEQTRREHRVEFERKVGMREMSPRLTEARQWRVESEQKEREGEREGVLVKGEGELNAHRRSRRVIW